MRNVIILPFVFFLTGITIYYNNNFIFTGAVFAALFFILYFKKSKAVAFYCIVFTAVGLLASSINSTVNNSRYAALESANSYTGIIAEKVDNTFTIIDFKRNYKIKMAVYESINMEPGDHIYFKGTVQRKPEFKRRIDNIYGTDAWVSYTKGSIEVKKDNCLLSLPYKIKYKLTTALNGIDNEGGAFVSGLICGYTGDISENSRDDFKKLGISHILAVSGFNLAVIYYVISLVTSKLNKKVRIPLILLICFTYSFICGFEPSITRAFIMICVSSLAGLTKKNYNAVNGLIVTAFFMLCFNTLYIYNIGFLFSFSASLGIVLFSRDISEKTPKSLSKVKNEAAVTLAAFISTLPLVLFYNGGFSILSILVNIIIAPLVSLVTVLGFISSILYIITSIKVVLYPVCFCGIIFTRMIQFFSQFSMSILPGKPLLLFVILYYLLIFIIFKYIPVKCSPKKEFYLKFVMVIAMLIILTYKSPGMKIHFINVGQGDCIFIETPHGSSIMVDTGPEFSNYTAARDKVIPYINKLGYNNIDMLFISHFHKDHAGGLKYIIQNCNIKNLFSYEIPENYKGVFSEISKGDIIKIDDVVINILYPDKNQDNAEPAQETQNETGLVMEVRYMDFNLLLTADSEKYVMDDLSGTYDILKVPHHGSINSLSENMLENSKIGSSVITVGKNSFGHPSQKVIDELIKYGSKVYRTDLQGDLTVRTDGEEYTISTQAE